MTEKSATATRVIRCPKCRRSVRYDTTNPYRPFCSALCKNEDIIAWAEQSYAIAGPEVDPEAMPPTQQGDEEEA